MSTVVAILQQARDATPSHQPTEIRKRMSDVCSEMSRGTIVPHKWQLDVAEGLLLGIDCEVIAATGAGKTLPFVLPLLVRPDMMVVILSPLDALELDQEYKFRKMGLRAKAINGKTYNDTVNKVRTAAYVKYTGSHGPVA
ncbi:hypothetical protein EDB86DRAFT_2818157 [Lactarius hatsudake]|nr:hypothetical protein EDB86DRAFT_2818157 [Lactarius hatsudake]